MMEEVGTPSSVLRLSQTALVALLSLSLGWHWVVLQTVAWTTMVVKRTYEASFAQALQTTFDGKHPCELCQLVTKGKAAEKKSAATFKLVQRDQINPIGVTLLLIHPRTALLHHSRAEPTLSRSEAPPYPPPRWVES